MVQCYGLMLRIAVTLRSNFLHFVTQSQTALVTQWYYAMVLLYGLMLHVCTHLYQLDDLFRVACNAGIATVAAVVRVEVKVSAASSGSVGRVGQKLVHWGSAKWDRSRSFLQFP